MTPPSTPTYNAAFFNAHEKDAITSAQTILPFALDWTKAQSVIDVGCGHGAWLSVCRAHGISDILGVDGDYVRSAQLLIPSESFQARNLERPFTLDRRFDLAMSLEVAEHLDPASAQAFIKTLTQLAPVVLFSAAIPHQGGAHHVNEQWQDYWAKRFEAEGFIPVDALRRRVWALAEVNWWYKQNMMLYVQRDRLADYPELATEAEIGSVIPLALVHPDKLREVCEPRRMTVTRWIEMQKTLLLGVPTVFGKAFSRRLKRLRRPKS
ncbi:MAG: methyltransferase domain-containing protein [Vampirovibrionales bacterium]|nr:methyltransferase domain-containing protein [Vampirovibrionales bacterium]